MIKYYDFVFLEKEKLIECLENKTNSNTKAIYLSPKAKQLLNKNDFKGIPVKVDDKLYDVYLYVEVI